MGGGFIAAALVTVWFLGSATILELTARALPEGVTRVFATGLPVLTILAPALAMNATLKFLRRRFVIRESTG